MINVRQIDDPDVSMHKLHLCVFGDDDKRKILCVITCKCSCFCF